MMNRRVTEFVRQLRTTPSVPMIQSPAAVRQTQPMDLVRNPAYLRGLAAAVTDFRDALDSFLELHHINLDFARGNGPAVWVIEGADPVEVRRRQRATSQAAGKAADAPSVTGLHYMVQGAGNVDPIAAWQTITLPKPLLEPNDIIDACGQILGRLEGLILKAEHEVPSSSTTGAEESARPTGRPRVFIGSSVEGKRIADVLQSRLDYAYEVEVWDQGTFTPGAYTLPRIAAAARTFDFAIMVMSPDDLTESRGQIKPAVRDNIILETGLFVGALSPERVFMVYDRDNKPALPSDLDGITPATYAAHSTGNLDAALGAPTTQIKGAMELLGRRRRSVKASNSKDKTRNITQARSNSYRKPVRGPPTSASRHRPNSSVATAEPMCPSMTVDPT
jgi:predicted nucleotide-binding protein